MNSAIVSSQVSSSDLRREFTNRSVHRAKSFTAPEALK